jgi:hypothetical protein
MAGKQAKVLSEQEVEDLLFFAKTTRNPDRNRVIILLSVKAGRCSSRWPSQGQN